MWNYRIVRKKSIYIDSNNNEEKTVYLYGIHEVYYDEKGFAGFITEEPMDPFGENVEELRHCWVMMAEAFGKPVLDFDGIPEPGYHRGEDPPGSELDRRLEGIESGREELIPRGVVQKSMEEKLGPFDEDEYRKQVEAERLETERMHFETFVGTPTLDELIKKIIADYQTYIERNRKETPRDYEAGED